jgi:antitoxin (DNA-binding transcriptional repressor) of toxin-antitoxin stability system
MQKTVLVLILIIALLLPVIAVAQQRSLERRETTATATPFESNETEIEARLRKEEGKVWGILEEKFIKIKNCSRDEDCLHIFCPAVIGGDTPMCVEGRCVCGPGRFPKYPINATKITICREVREKMKEFVEKMKEEKNQSRMEELLNQLVELRERNKECFPRPARIVPFIALESAVKKAQAVDEFLEGMKNLREELLNNITSQNLTGRELAQVIKEYNEKRKELVKEFVQRIHEINMERMEEIKEVVVARHVKWENETLFNVTRVTVTVNGKNITIEPGDNVTISVEGVVVKSIIPLKVKNNTIEDADTNQTIRETPDRIKARIREQIREMKLERKENKPVYIVAAAKQGRLLGIIPVNVSVNYEISAIDGSTIKVNRPWWSFLVLG